jgi:hypothetical protein
VLTDYVIVEIANALSLAPFRKAAVQTIAIIQSSAKMKVVEVDKEVFAEGWRL